MPLVSSPLDRVASFFREHPAGVLLLAVATLLGTVLAVVALWSGSDDRSTSPVQAGVTYAAAIDSCRVGAECGDDVPILAEASLSSPAVYSAADGESLVASCEVEAEAVADSSVTEDPYTSTIWFLVQTPGGVVGYVPDVWFGRVGSVLRTCEQGQSDDLDEVLVALAASGASRAAPLTDEFEFRVVPGSCSVQVCNSGENAIEAIMSGFTPSSAVSISVELPDGRDGNDAAGQYSYIENATTDATGDFTWRWWGTVGDQLGTYSTTVVDVATGRQIVATFELTE